MVAIFALLFSLVAHAEIPRVAPESAADFPTTVKRDRSVRVKGARVAWANFAGIRERYAQTRHLTDAQINEWVVENFAFISEAQAKLNGVRQSDISVDAGAHRENVRQEGWGRAGMFEAPGGGMIDVKGAGLAEGDPAIEMMLQVRDALTHGTVDKLPAEILKHFGKGVTWDALRTLDHSDGLMSLGEAVAELSRERAVHYLLGEKKPPGHVHDTVQSLFVIELPFDILKSNGDKIPAALYGREGHFGRISTGKTPDALFTDPFGKGQTAGADHRKIDMGGVFIRDARLRANFGEPLAEDPQNTQRSRAWSEAHNAAGAFRSGKTGAIYDHLAQMLEPIKSVIADAPSTRAQLKYKTPAAHPEKFEHAKYDAKELLAAADGFTTPEHAKSFAHFAVRKLDGKSPAELKELYLGATNESADAPAAIAGELVRRGGDPWTLAREKAERGAVADHAIAAAVIGNANTFAPGKMPDEFLERLLAGAITDLREPRRPEKLSMTEFDPNVHVKQYMMAFAINELLARGDQKSTDRIEFLLGTRHVEPFAVGLVLDNIYQKQIAPLIKPEAPKSLSEFLTGDARARIRLAQDLAQSKAPWKGLMYYLLMSRRKESAESLTEIVRAFVPATNNYHVVQQLQNGSENHKILGMIERIAEEIRRAPKPEQRRRTPFGMPRCTWEDV